MDFLALPRRDLQALCKRNGVRANMTNVAMADALRALPKVDGIEEYVKQPVPVSEPEAAKAAVAEEKNAGKQGNPLPRGRRVVAKSSEPVEPEEEEKGNGKRQACKEDEPAPGVGRRGASRCAGLVPVVPQLAAMAEQASKREAKRDNAAAAVVGRRGASRRARPSPAVAAQAAESEVAGAEEEQSDKVEDLEREAIMDDVPALGVGRRGANRRARVAPSVAAMAGKVVAEEEQRAQIGRCVRAKGTSSEPITLDDSDDEEMEDAQPEEQQEDAQILGVGRRGRASRRAPAASEDPATSRSAAASKADAGDVAVEAVPRATRQRKPTMKAAAAAAAAEEEAPRRTLRRGAVMSTLVQQEVQEEPQEAVGAPDMAVEAVPIRPTRQRKPEEKAPRRAARRGPLQQEMQEQPQDVVTADEQMEVATSDEVAELTETGDEGVEEMKTPPIVDEKQQHTVTSNGDIVDDHFKTNVAHADEQKEGVSTEVPEITGTDSEIEDTTPLIVDEKKQSITTNANVVFDHFSMVTEAYEDDEGAEAVDAPVSHQQCNAQEELTEASYPQKEELNKVDAAKKDEDQDLVIIEDENMMKEISAEETSVTDQKCIDNKLEMQEQLVEDEKSHAPLANHEESPILRLVSMVTEQAPEDDEEAMDAPASHVECMDKSEMQEQIVDDEKCHASLANHEESLILGLVSMVTEQASKDNEEAMDAPSSHVECMDKSEMQEQIVDDEKCHAPLANHEESPILGLVSMVTEQASEDNEEDVDALVSHQECEDKSEMQEQLVSDEKSDAPLSNHEESPIHVLVSMATEQASEDDEEIVDARVSHLRCDALEELADASDPQKQELNEVDAPKQDENQDVIITENGKLEETITEEPYVAHQEWMDNSEMLEQQVDDEKCHALLATNGEPPVLHVSTETEQVSQDDVGVAFQDDGGSSSGLDKDVCEDTYDAGEEMELVTGVQTVQAPSTGNESDDGDANHEGEIGDFNEALAFLNCSSNISKVVEKDINEKLNTVGVETSEEVTTEDGLGCQEEGDLVVDKMLHDLVDNTILLDCSSDISGVVREKAENVTSEMPDNRAALDEDGDVDKVRELTGSNVNVGDKNRAEPMAVLEEKGVKLASKCEDLTKLSLAQLKAKLKEKLIAKNVMNQFCSINDSLQL